MLLLEFIGNRCCRSHLMMKNKRFYQEDIGSMTIHSYTSQIHAEEVHKLFATFSARIDSELIDRVPENLLDEKRLKVFTGLTWEQFNKVRSMITVMRNSSTRDISQALIVFLLKLRSGNSNSLVSSILGLQSEQKVSDYSDSVLRAFKVDILPANFGLHAHSR